MVHVTWQDAATYAAWASKRLPTEAEFEFAARGGVNDCTYPWGRQLMADSDHPDSGHRPRVAGPPSAARSGPGRISWHLARATVPAESLGLYDMAGNVWNWCADWYATDYYGTSLWQTNLGDPAAGPSGSAAAAAGFRPSTTAAGCASTTAITPHLGRARITPGFAAPVTSALPAKRFGRIAETSAHIPRNSDCDFKIRIKNSLRLH